MGLNCEYCGSALTGKERNCPNCGAAVPAFAVQTHAIPAGAPKTIAELKAFAEQKKLPLRKMRVFIGEDFREPKAFGIYQERADSFVVYKNKSDGSRAIRYRGPDEAYAVGELYQKMRDMVKQQKAFQSSVRSGSSARSGSGGVSGLPKWVKWALVILIVVILWSALFGRSKRRGYYHYNNDYYYQQNGSWYQYQDGGWTPFDIGGEFADSYEDYYQSGSYSSGYGIDDFSNSGYYVEPAQDDYDDDSWDWDNDDWGDDDWDWGGDWDDIGDWDSDW